MRVDGADVELLRRTVGESSFDRGRAYAERGAVRNVRSLADGQQLFGDVAGTAPTPYTVWVRLSRSQMVGSRRSVAAAPARSSPGASTRSRSSSRRRPLVPTPSCPTPTPPR